METQDWVMYASEIKLSVQDVINGETVKCLGQDSIIKLSPRDGALLYRFPEGSRKSVDLAVSYAKQSFCNGCWSELPVQQRKTILNKLASLVEKNTEKFALYECLDVGKPITQAITDVGESANILRSFAEGADKVLLPSFADGYNYQLRKPVGVVAAIIGWNFPLILAIQKLGSALAMGNSLVLKPSEFTSLSAGYLAELAVEAGVPPGVFNVVHGKGEIVGAALAHHPDVNLISFTGSSATGKQIMRACAQSNMKRLMLECGGKSPFIVFDDCPEDIDYLASQIVFIAFQNQGAWCVSGTRLLVHQDIKAKLLSKVIEKTAELTPGDPLNTETNFGALINEEHLKKVLNYIASGKKEGAKLVQGGKRISCEVNNPDSEGFYLEPTIFDEVHPRQKIAQEEIFGPVLSVLTFNDEDEAIKIANGTNYGLAAYVASVNIGRVQRMSKSLNAGFFMAIGSSNPLDRYVEIGLEGHRESGFGHEGGLMGLLSYTVGTSVHLFV